MSSADRASEFSPLDDHGAGSAEEIAAYYADRLIAGEKIDADEILSAYPVVGPEVLEHLEFFIGVGSSDADIPLGTLGDYTLRRQIGRGGMGVVYEAWESSMDRVVALKVLPAGIAADTRASTRFMREAQAAGKLNHPNVVGVYSTGVKEGIPWYAMEYVEGQTLAQILMRIRDAEPEMETSFGKKDCAGYFEQLARAFADVSGGLQHAHSKGVTHRDIKPSNLILEGDGRLRILDFGLAHLEGQDSLTISGDVVGTPLYMSPEQARRKKIPIDHRTDIYSLGSTMYEAICGRPPFRGKNHADTLSQIIERDPVEPRKVNSRVPKDLETIVLKCLRKDAGDRYRTAEALGQDLLRFVRGDAVEAKPPSLIESLLHSAWRWRRRAALGVLALLFGVSAVAWILEIRHRDAGARDERYLEIVERAVGQTSDAWIPGGLTEGIVASRQRMAGSGAIMAARQRLEAGIGELNEAIALFPDRPLARYVKARAMRGLQDRNASLAELDELLARSPGFIPALVTRAYYRLAAGENSLPNTDLDKAAAIGAGWGRTWLDATQALENADWEVAIEGFSTILSENDLQDSGRDARSVGFIFDILVARGIAYLETRRLDDAERDLTSAHERWPEALLPVVLLGQVYVVQGKPEVANRWFLSVYEKTRERHRAQAARSFSDAFVTAFFTYSDYRLAWLEKVPRGLGLLTDLGHVLLVANRAGKAIDAALERLEEIPDDRDAHIHLARAYCALEQEAEARKYLERALDFDTRALAPGWSAGYLFFAGRELVLNLEEPARAEQAMRESLRIQPDMEWAPYWIARSLSKRGLIEQSMTYCKTVLEERPFTEGLRGYLSLLHRLRGDYDQAASWAREGIKKDATGGDYRIRLGNALWRVVDFETIEAILEEAILSPAPGIPDRAAKLGLVDLRRCSGRTKASFHLLTRLLAKYRGREEMRTFRRLLAEDPSLASPENLADLARSLEDSVDDTTQSCLEWAALALARLYIGKPRDALEAAEKAIEIKPSSVLAEIARSDVFAYSNDLVAEVRSLERALHVLGLGRWWDRSRELVRLDHCREALLPDLASIASADSLRETPTRTLVGDGETWKYLAGDALPPRDWMRPGYDDQYWRDGKGAFGQTRIDSVRTHLVGPRANDTTIWLRKRFSVVDTSTFVELRLSIACDHGFVAWLNGEKVAAVPIPRVRWTENFARHQGPLEPVDFSVPVDRIRAGENVLAIRGLAGPEPRDLFLLPLLRGVLSEGERARLLADFHALPKTPQRRGIAKYLEGRDLEEAERFDDAARAFVEARRIYPKARELLLAIVGVLVEAGRFEEVMGLLESALGEPGSFDAGLFEIWLETALGRVGLAAKDAVRRFPLDRPHECTRPYDALWGLRQIVSRGRLRINCGAYLERVDENGVSWSRDRFFVGQTEASPVGGGSAPWEERKRVDATERQLGGGRYSIPLPRGNYDILLRFTGRVEEGESTRRFAVLIEGVRVLEDVEPGPGVEEQSLGGINVEDGLLDIELDVGSGKPALITIEVSRG